MRIRGGAEMFVDERRTVARSFEEVAPAFLERSAPWLPELMRGSMEHGYSTTTQLGVGLLSKRVHAHLGDPLVTGRRLVVPIRVMATGPHGLFPQLDANIEILAVDSGSIELRLVGTYRPPFVRTGEALDRMVLHRVAEATIKNLMNELVSRLDHPTFLKSVGARTA
jgi:hypothetical protein